MLNIRWASADPNPGVRKRKLRDAEVTLLDAANSDPVFEARLARLRREHARGKQTTAAERRSGASRRDCSYCSGEGCDDVCPDSEAAAAAVAAAEAAAELAAAEKEEAEMTLLEAASAGLPAGWQAKLDPATGHPYYTHAGKSVTTWLKPKPTGSLAPASGPPVTAGRPLSLGLVGYGSSSDSDGPG